MRPGRCPPPSQFKSQWRNKCIRTTYEPGSTFKPITAAALEEGVVNMNTTFTCTGSIHVQGWNKPLTVPRRAGHGSQTLKVATGNSCNPAFITMGLKMGTETYYKYLKSFGLMENTGIDMIGEAKRHLCQMRTASTQRGLSGGLPFGQTFNVTPIELIRPRQPASTAATCIPLSGRTGAGRRRATFSVQHDTTRCGRSSVRRPPPRCGSAWSGGVRRRRQNGQVTGYRIGGKTGTADKTGTKGTWWCPLCASPRQTTQGDHAADHGHPSRTTGTAVFGGTMVAPVASQIMSEILPLLGIEPDYTAEELVGADTTVPNVVGQTREAAEDAG